MIGIVANLRVEKDHPTLIRALRRLRDQGFDTHVAIVGDGPREALLRQMAQALDLADRVHFTGHLPNRPNIHNLFDVSVLCSRSEGFSNSLLEAMAAGKSIVATRAGGNPDLVEHGRTGLLVPPGSDKELAAAIRRLLEDRQVRDHLGKAARERARRFFSAGSVIPQLEQLYDGLWRNPRNSSGYR